MIDRDEPFENRADEYDAWYERHRLAYRSELRALRRLVGRPGRALEVGVGTGRFAAPLGVAFGVDPAGAMLRRARERDVAVVRAVGEELPVGADSLDLVLVALTLCFFDAPDRALIEARRVLRPDGRLVLGFLDPTSPPGRRYREESRGPFYEGARFYPPRRNGRLPPGGRVPDPTGRPDALRPPVGTQRGGRVAARSWRGDVRRLRGDSPPS